MAESLRMVPETLADQSPQDRPGAASGTSRLVDDKRVTRNVCSVKSTKRSRAPSLRILALLRRTATLVDDASSRHPIGRAAGGRGGRW
jgi:hypothetical protein